jgi:hypothetical protein
MPAVPDVPLIQPSTQVGGVPAGPHLDPGSYAQLSTSGLRAFAGAAQTIAHEAGALAEEQRRIKSTLDAEADKLAADQAANVYKVNVADTMAKVSQDVTITPQQYAPAVEEASRKARASIGKGLTTTRARVLFERQADDIHTATTINARSEGLKLELAGIKSGAALQVQEWQRTAIHHPDEAERIGAVAKIEEHILDFQRKTLYSANEAGALRLQSTEIIARGRTEKDFVGGDASMKNAVLSDLRNGRVQGIPVQEQSALARTLEQQEHTAAERRRTEQERDRKELADDGDKRLTNLVSGGDFAGARTELSRYERVFTGSQYREWMQRIDKGAVKVTDPAVAAMLIPLVYNAQNNPLEVDTRVRAEYARGTVADDDMKAWAAHLETRQNRVATQQSAAAARRTADQAREDTRIAREQGDVEQQIRGLTTVTGALSPYFNQAAQDTYNWAVEDMHRNNPLYGGNERPMQWLNRNRPTILGRVQSAGTERVKSIDATLAFSDPATKGTTPEAIRRSQEVLKSQQRSMRLDDYVDKIRMIEEKKRIGAELDKYRPPRPTTPAEAAPTREPSLGGGGQKMGR